MKILKVEAKNFWSFKDLEFDLQNQGLCLVQGMNHDEGDSNGSGKSGLFGSVCFALFGVLPKKIKMDDVINQDEGKGCVATIWLDHNGQSFKISRGRKPNFLHFEVDEVSLADVDVSKTQQLIEKRLGITFDTFINSVFFPQNGINFLALNDAQRKQILTDIIELHIFDEVLEQVKEKYRKQELIAARIKTDIEYKQKSLEKIKEDIMSFKTSGKFFDEEKQQKVSSIKKELETVKAEIEKLKLLGGDYREQQTIAENELKEFEKKYEEKKWAIAELETSLQELNKEKNKINPEINLLKKQLNKYELNVAECPTCFQKVNQKILAGHKEEVNKDIVKLQKKLVSVEAELSELPSSIELDAKKDKLRTQQNDLTNKIKYIIKDYNNNTQMVSNMETRLESLNKNFQSENKAVNPYKELVAKKESEQNNLLEEISLAQVEYDKENNYLLELDALKEVFGNKGIKSYVFDNVINEMNTRVNEYLGQLFEGNVRMMFLTQSEDSKGNLKQNLTLQVTVNEEEVSLGRFSGGEERRLSFAINLALADIIANRSNNSFSTMFLDESFDGLSYEGKRKCLNLLQELSKTKESIFIIDHATEFANEFDNVITVEKRNGISAVV